MLLQPGTTLFNGKYRVDALVGQGASAEVYRVTHIALKQQRALKVLRRDASGVGSTEFGDYRQRFRLEAQLGAKIINPNVIQVFDFEDQDDQLMLVMEYAPGGSLAERLARYRERGQLMPVDEAVGILLDVANGLTAVHDLAAHRDLKPSNILFDANGHAKIADLGMAQVPGGPSLRSILSTAMPHPGTPSYMSPEQQSSPAYLSPASDIYTVGLIAFEMLTGRSYKHERAGKRTSALNRDVPPKLDDLVLRMLSAVPEQRPFKGDELLEDVRALGIAPMWNRDEAWQATQEQARQQAENERKTKEEYDKLTHDTAKSIVDTSTATSQPNPVVIPEFKSFPATQPSATLTRIAVIVGTVIALAGIGFLALQLLPKPIPPAQPTSSAATTMPTTTAAIETRTSVVANTPTTEPTALSATKSTDTPIPDTSTPQATFTPLPSETSTLEPTFTPSPKVATSTPKLDTPTAKTQVGLNAFVIDDFEESIPIISGRFKINRNADNGGSFSITNSTGIHGKQALAFNYDIRNDAPQNYIGFETEFAPQDWSEYSQVCLLVGGDNSNRSLVFQFGRFENKYTRSLGNGLVEYCYPLTTQNDVNLRAIGYYGIYIEGPPKGTGSITVDYIHLIK